MNYITRKGGWPIPLKYVQVLGDVFNNVIAITIAIKICFDKIVHNGREFTRNIPTSATSTSPLFGVARAIAAK